VAIRGALRTRRATVWVPRKLEPIMTAVRHLPRPVFRRLRG